MRTATPPYGFLYDDAGDALIVSEPEMAVVEKVFRLAPKGSGRGRYRRGCTPPASRPRWAARCGT
jgi:hypothetical protein